MTNGRFLALAAAMGLVTYLPRWLPLAVLPQRRLPRWLVEWLDLLPAALLGALVVPALVTSGEPRHLDLGRPELLAGVPTLIFAWKTRSLGGTVAVGMLLFWALGKLA